MPVDRPPGGNRAGIVAGARAHADRASTRRASCASPSSATRRRSLGSVSEPECSRIVAAHRPRRAACGVPVEWFAISSGAKISRDSGTENMDWVSRVLRRLITFTQAGGEVNVVVAGINVGAQPYWNAEATMLLHTRGILVMTPDSAMVLTGKQALDYSGGVSAEDNFGIGGYDRIMGPNGQAQYWAPDLAGACEVLLAHYAHSYVAPGEQSPRRADDGRPGRSRRARLPARGPGDHLHDGRRDLLRRDQPRAQEAVRHPVGDERRHRPGPPAARALGDDGGRRDRRRLRRAPRRHPGHASSGSSPGRSRARGFLPADGPDQWTAGTLFPLSSKKVARAINAASGNRPLVVLANLSGFDGSPESLRKRQLEYGAEIGRAVVNFDGPIVFCVVSRYHGGAFVVFSGALNDDMEVLAVEGSYASVIGGAPAAAVVFAGDVAARTDADPRVAELQAGWPARRTRSTRRLRAELDDVRAAVRSEKLGEVAAEFDAIHSVERALRGRFGRRDHPGGRLRPRLIEAVERRLALRRAD